MVCTAGTAAELGSYNCLVSPGRFFAANELKIMMANLVLKYDIKFADGSRRPKNEWMATTIQPSATAQVLFRKRTT